MKKNTKGKIYFSFYVALMLLASFVVSSVKLSFASGENSVINTFLLAELAIQICAFVIPSVIFIRFTGHSRSAFSQNIISLPIKFALCICTAVFLIGISSLYVFSFGYLNNTYSVPVNSVGDFLKIFLVYCIAPAICEEIAFRWIILGFLKRHGTVYSILFSALIFACIHFSASEFLLYFLGGALFGGCYVLTGSIIYPILCHLIYNFYSVFFSASIQSAVYSASAPLYVFVFGTLLLISLALVFYICEHIFFLHSVNTQSEDNTIKASFITQIADVFRMPITIISLVLFVIFILLQGT